jgi:predicted ATP-grasp superfamily ATP-dependent carboligase
LSEDIKIVEETKVSPGAIFIFGFPDVGLVGLIAASHLVDELCLKEVAYVNVAAAAHSVARGFAALIDENLRWPRYSLSGF